MLSAGWRLAAIQKSELLLPGMSHQQEFLPAWRYILTGGSDGTTLAAVLTGLAAKGVVSIQSQAGSYAITLLNTSTVVVPDEASVVRTLFNVVSTVQPYADSNTAIVGDRFLPTLNGPARADVTFPLSGQPMGGKSIFRYKEDRSGFGAAVGRSPSLETQAVIDPLAAAAIKSHIDALQDTFRKNLQGIYFRQNFRYVGIGMAATFSWALLTAATLDAPSSMFITFWLLLFTSISGLVIGGVWTSKPTHPSARQRVTRVPSH